MKLKDITGTVRQALDSDRLAEVTGTMTGNKSRTLLTAFGIFWGVFMLVLLLGGGKGLQGIMLANFGGVAKNTGFVAPDKTTKAYKGYAKGRDWYLDQSDAGRLRRHIRNISNVEPLIMRNSLVAKYGKRTYGIQALKGITPGYCNIELPAMKYGRFINWNDIHRQRKACVIGRRVFEQLFPDGGNPCGQFISIGGIYYEIVGVDMHKSNIGIGGQPTESVQVPYTVMQHIYNTGTRIDALAYTAHSGTTVASIEGKVKSYLCNIHDIHPDDSSAIMSFNAEVLFQMFDNLFRGINILVWLIGVGTVTCGVIGVTNIMLVSIRERTSELGIRRAIGAKPRDILVQILTESEIMTLLAGLSGIVAAVGILAAVEPIVRQSTGTQAQFQIPFPVAAAMAASLCLLGLAAGVFPALRAVAIKPVEAMRDE